MFVGTLRVDLSKAKAKCAVTDKYTRYNSSFLVHAVVRASMKWLWCTHIRLQVPLFCKAKGMLAQAKLLPRASVRLSILVFIAIGL